MTVEEVLALRDELRNAPGTADRLNSYQRILKAIALDVNEAERLAFYRLSARRERASYEAGLSDTSDAFSVDISIPLTQQMIEDQRTVIGAARSFRVPLPNDSAQQYADRLEKAIAHLWREWNFPSLLSSIGWYCAVLGTAIGVLQWDSKDRFPRAVVRSPENCYAVPSPDNEYVPLLAMFEVKATGRMLKHQYRDNKEVQLLSDDTEYEVVDYYDADVRMRVVNECKTPLLEAKNPLKRIPVYFFRNILIPNSIWGSTMMSRAIAIEQEINRLYSEQAKYIRMVMEAPTFIKDPENVPENFTWNSDTVVTMGPQGGIGKAPIASIDPRVFEYRLEDMKQNLDKTMDFSNVARGQFDGSQLTAKGVKALAGFASQRMMIRLQSIDAEIERMTEDALYMWHKGGGKMTRTIYGTIKGSMFSESFNPKTDIDPSWIKVYVYLDSASFVDRQAQQITNLQKLRGEPQVMSVRRFLELDPDCEDVEMEIKRIEEERRRAIQLQIEAQMQVQSAAQTQTPTEQAYAAERGGMVEGAKQPAPQPAQPAPEAPAEEMAPEGAEDLLPAVADLFRSIPKIKGRVWLVGEWLLEGVTPEEFAQGFIEVAVENELDKQTILNGLRRTELAGAVEQQRLVFHGTSILERKPWIEVTPGTEGYEVQEGGVESGEEEPEEAAAGYGAEVQGAGIGVEEQGG